MTLRSYTSVGSRWTGNSDALSPTALEGRLSSVVCGGTSVRATLVIW